MAKRLGIELSPSTCRIVELEGPDSPARVRSFHTFEYSPGDAPGLAGQLKPFLRGRRLPRRASVVLWGLPASHQWLLLPPAKPADLEAVARREARRDPNIPEPDLVLGVAAGRDWQAPGGPPKREVMVASSSAKEIRARLWPLVQAGLDIGAVATPPLALTSVARLRRGGSPDAAVGYLAVNASSSALAIVRGGMLLFARELPWGHQHTRAQTDRRELAEKLASELRRSFLYFKQTFQLDVQRLVTCGDLPGLRSMTAMLIEALDVEVETLDSMEGIDITAVPEPAEQFREGIAALRLAIAVGADAAPPVNLLPSDVREGRTRRVIQLGAGAAAAAGLILAAGLFLMGDGSARAAERRLGDLQQQVSALEPRARELQEALQQQALSGPRRAALQAFSEQGQRLARVLETIGRNTPPEIVLTSLKAEPDGALWHLTLAGKAVAPDAARAHAAYDRFLQAIKGSRYLGQPSRPPNFKLVAGFKEQVPEPSVERQLRGAGAEVRLQRVDDWSRYTPEQLHRMGHPERRAPKVQQPVGAGIRPFEPAAVTRPLIPETTLEFVFEFEVRK